MDTENKTLLPCPFCGSKDIDIVANEEDAYCLCDNCLAEGAIGNDEECAIDNWNTRYTQESKVSIPKEPTLQLIADLYYKGDIAMTIGNASMTEEFKSDYKKALDNYTKG